MGGFQISSQNLVLEFGLRDDLPMRIAISNAATSLMMALGPLLGGFIVTSLSYVAVFWTAIAVQAAALALVIARVEEPRFRQRKV
jgi:predicted MFS family arabinose efflux permease